MNVSYLLFLISQNTSGDLKGAVVKYKLHISLVRLDVPSLFQPPLEFRERMLQGCKDRAVMLQDYVETVMEGLQTVANILAVKKVITQ